MNILPSASAFILLHDGLTDDNAIDLMKKFASIHVKAALEAAADNVELRAVKYTDNDWEVDKSSILSAYPESLIQ